MGKHMINQLALNECERQRQELKSIINTLEGQRDLLQNEIDIFKEEEEVLSELAEQIIEEGLRCT